jgi:hypothetical protein
MRTSNDINRDFFEWAKNYLERRAVREWNYETIDFDPLINLLFGAFASEYQTIHDAINSTDTRLLHRLTNTILPEVSHLPQPAMAIMKAQCTGEDILIDEKVFFNYEKDSEIFYFSPVFPSRLIDESAMQIVFNRNLPVDTITLKRVSICLGNIKKEISLNFLNIHFEVNTKYLSRSRLIQALANGKIYCNNVEIESRNGFLSDDILLSDQFFDNDFSNKKRVHDALKKSFISISDEQLFEPIDGQIWLDIALPFEVSKADVEQNLKLSINHFPVLNRKVQTIEKYFQEPTINVVQIPVDTTFAGVYRVLNKVDMKPIILNTLSHFSEAKQPCYSIRSGGTGRYDEYNIWKQFSYLLNIYRAEHRNQELLNHLGGDITIEELHEWLGKNIDKDQANLTKGKSDTYVYVHTPFPYGKNGLEIKVEYWVTNGANANNLTSGLAFGCSISGIDEESVYLVTTPQNGKNKPTDNQKIEHLRDALTRRDRISSIKDITSFCKSKIGSKLLNVKVSTIIEVLPHSDKSLGKMVLVELKLKDPSSDEWDFLLDEMEVYLNENSLSIINYKIKKSSDGSKRLE